MADGGPFIVGGGSVNRRENEIVSAATGRRYITLIALLIAAAVILNFASLLAPEFIAGFDDFERQMLAVSRIAILALLAIITLRTFRRTQTAPTPLHDALNMLPVAAALWREDGTLEHCNAVMRQQFGLPEHTPLAAQQVDQLRVCNFNGRPTQSNADQFEVDLPEGRILHVTGLKLTNGRCLCVIKDISEHRQTKTQLAMSLKENQVLMQRFREEALRAEAASRSKTAFLAHLSHDIRTPLNHIIGFAELIRNEAFGNLGNPRYHTYLDDIKGSGERLLDSFAEVLELAELEGGRRELKREPVEVANLFSQLDKRFASAAQRAGIELCFEAPEQCWLSGDQVPFQKMLGNLVDNALRFTSRGGRVSVVAWESDSEMVLEISDTGIGIPPQQIADLSMPFVLGDAAFAREHGGMGLGIAISRTIAELSGGRLVIESTPPIGTTVAISLPQVAVSEVEAA